MSSDMVLPFFSWQSDTDLASPVTSPSASSSSCSANKRLPIASTNSHSSRKKSPTTIDLKCGDAAVRLAKDSRLAIEAHEVSARRRE